MITKHLIEVTTKFNPFTKKAKTCRVFLAHLPPNARQTMKINTQILPRGSREKSSLHVKFSTSVPGLDGHLYGLSLIMFTTPEYR